MRVAITGTITPQGVADLHFDTTVISPSLYDVAAFCAAFEPGSEAA